MRNHYVFVLFFSTLIALFLLGATPALPAEDESELQRKLAEQEQALGPDHPDLAAPLNRLVVLYYGQGQYAKAEALAQRVLTIGEKAYGPDHLDLTTSLNNLARLYEKQGQYSQAEPLYKRTLAIREKELGPEHPSVAASLNSLAALYVRQGKYAQAEPLMKQSLAIRERALGPEHPSVAASLNNLAALYMRQGQSAQAEPLLKRSLAIREKQLGPNHPDVAKSLNGLAELYRSQAQYAQAEPLYQRALAIQEKQVGLDHPDVAIILNNLAALYRRQSQYARAESLYLRTLDIWEKSLGAEHPQVAICLNNLGDLHTALAQYSEAGALYQRALAIREKQLGPDHPDVAASLNNLAGLYELQKQYTQAEPLYRRVLKIQESALPPDHPNVAASLNNLAALYQSQQRYAEAEPLMTRVLAIGEKVYGPDHPDVAASLNNLASLYKGQSQYDEAEPLMKRALAIVARIGTPEHLWSVQGNLGDLYGKLSKPDLAIFYVKQAVNTLQEVRTGNTQMDMASQRSFLKSHEGTYTHLADWLFAQNRLAEGQQVLDMLKEAEYHEFNGKSDKDDPRRSRVAYTPREAKWEQRFRDLAEKLRQTTPESKEDAALKKEFDAFFEDVQKAFAQDAPGEPNRLDNTSPLQKPLGELGEGTVLIQYLMPEDRLWLLITTGESMKAHKVDIGADALVKKVSAFRGAVVSRNPEVNKQGRELFDLLIKPAAEDLKNSKTLMLAPDGALRYLPFAALHNGEKYLVQRYTLANFTDMTKKHITDRPVADWNFAGFGVSKGGEGLSPLPAVPQELEGIRDEAISGTIRLDAEFTHKALQEALHKMPPVVHLASHFVFRRGNEQSSYLLTGDGKLTLAEIRGGYRFDDVDLVALSACETGVGGGEDQNGREVEGLGVLVQRQGAKGVLASLWPVNDNSTGQFMRLFYGYRQQDKLNKAEALQKAQLAFIEDRVSAALAEASRNRGVRGGAVAAGADIDAPQMRADTRISHPYHWAAFILMGNWL